MADLSRHEAGNGGYRQREPKATAPVLYSTEILSVSVADAVLIAEGSTLIAVSPNLPSLNRAGSSGTWRGDEGQTGSETVARFKGRVWELGREAPSVLSSKEYVISSL